MAPSSLFAEHSSIYTTTIIKYTPLKPDRGEEDEEASRKSRLGLNNDDDEEEGPRVVILTMTWMMMTLRRGMTGSYEEIFTDDDGIDLGNYREERKDLLAAPPEVKQDSKSSVKEDKTTLVPKTNTLSKSVKAERTSSSAATGPVTEDEIRTILMEKKQVTTHDLVSRFKARLKTKEDKGAFADILRKISKIQKNTGSQYFVSLEGKMIL